MSDERRQILAMLAEGKVSVEEAERLLEALKTEGTEDMRASLREKADDAGKRKKPKFLCIRVRPKAGDRVTIKNRHRHQHHRGERVNIKVPLFLLRTGLKLKGILPEEVKEKITAKLGEKGINLNDMDDESFEELIKGLTELSIEVDDDDEEIRICCE